MSAALFAAHLSCARHVGQWRWQYHKSVYRWNYAIRAQCPVHTFILLTQMTFFCCETCSLVTYTVWLNVSSHPIITKHKLVEYLIPKPWLLIWSWSSCGAIKASTLLGNVSTRICFFLVICAQFRQKVRYLCSMREPVSKFITKILCRVQICALCRPLKVLHANSSNHFFIELTVSTKS